MKYSLLILISLLAACAGQPGANPQVAATAQETYCVAKKMYCDSPSVELSGDAMAAKMVYCSVNTICIPPVPASPASGVIK